MESHGPVLILKKIGDSKINSCRATLSHIIYIVFRRLKF